MPRFLSLTLAGRPNICSQSSVAKITLKPIFKRSSALPYVSSRMRKPGPTSSLCFFRGSLSKPTTPSRWLILQPKDSKRRNPCTLWPVPCECSDRVPPLDLPCHIHPLSIDGFSAPHCQMVGTTRTAHCHRGRRGNGPFPEGCAT